MQSKAINGDQGLFQDFPQGVGANAKLKGGQPPLEINPGDCIHCIVQSFILFQEHLLYITRSKDYAVLTFGPLAAILAYVDVDSVDVKAAVLVGCELQ